MNLKIILLVLGLLAGSLIGYVTRPATAAISIPGINVQIKTDGPPQGGSLTRAQTQHIAIWAVIGAIVGFGAGFIAERRR
jgi:hypothetical protein